MIVGGADAWIGGARLRPTDRAKLETWSSDLDGIVKVHVTYRNFGFRPGGIRSVTFKPYATVKGALRVTSHEETHERALPLQSRTHTLDLVVRRSKGPLETLVKLIYTDTDDDYAFEKVLVIKCGEKGTSCEVATT